MGSVVRVDRRALAATGNSPRTERTDERLSDEALTEDVSASACFLLLSFVVVDLAREIPMADWILTTLSI